jgi:hypothetical protein
MTLRLTPEQDAAVTARAEREGKSKQKVIEDAIDNWTGERTRRLHDIAHRIVAEDAGLLERLAQ